jgi:mRNA interferase MazF
MRRGEIWTVSGAGGYVAKPRPVVIVRDDAFDLTHSICVCPFTSDQADMSMLRILVAPSAANGLMSTSQIMVDKISAVPRSKLGRRIGVLEDGHIGDLSQAILVFLGLARSPRRAAPLAH